MRSITSFGRLPLIMLFALAVWGCSSGNSNSPLLDSSGKHPAGWITVHGAKFAANRDQCTPCHGSYTVAAQSGGISGVSCFSTNIGTQTCHANGPSLHPANWGDASQHGRAGAMAAPSAATGFAYCQKCHGSTFHNGTARSCFYCHTKAPHPDAPWHGTTVSRTNHIYTDQGNATVCGGCHLGGAFLSTPVAVPPGTTPGCFNNTLCHGSPTSIGHPVNWVNYDQHGKAAKGVSAVGGSTGFGYCQKCHGSAYTGSGSAVSCFSASVAGVNCHNGGAAAPAPHPIAPWLLPASILVTHTDTDQTNASSCGGCHYNNQRLGSPTATIPAGTTLGCFNGTMCHTATAAPPHIANISYLDPGAHGVDAKANLISCQPCHAIPGSGLEPVYNVPKNNMPSGCVSCHTSASVPIPHPTPHPIPWLPGRPGGIPNNPNTTTHATAGNLATACALCHGVGLTGSLTGPGPSCMTTGYSSTVCHASNPATNPTGCLSCHHTPPDGSSFPNTANSHTVHRDFFASVTASCQACHFNFGMDPVTKFGKPTHADKTINLALSGSYLAKTGGAFTFNAAGKTCANVSCHGGQTTPGWNTVGTINVDTDCTSCHRARTTSDQFNSYFSGNHGDHGSVACTTCHATTKLAPGHFTNLDTPAFEQHPRTTITFVNPDNGAVLTTIYNAATQVYTCTFTCHGETHSGRTWTGSP